MKAKTVEIPPVDWEGSLQDYVQMLSKKYKHITEKLRTVGVPSEGYCHSTTTRGDVFVRGSAYKDFTVTSLAVLVGNQDDLDPYSSDGILHLTVAQGVALTRETRPEDHKVWRVWLMDITRNGSDSFIEYAWDDAASGGRVTIENINTALIMSNERNGPGRATSDVIAQLKRLLPGLRLIELAEGQRGRPKEGSGWFRNIKDFRTAMKETLATQTKRPTQLRLLKLLDDHPLCQLKPDNERNQSHTKLLRDWLKKRLKLKSYDEALDRYWKSAKRGE